MTKPPALPAQRPPPPMEMPQQVVNGLSKEPPFAFVVGAFIAAVFFGLLLSAAAGVGAWLVMLPSPATPVAYQSAAPRVSNAVQNDALPPATSGEVAATGNEQPVVVPPLENDGALDDSNEPPIDETAGQVGNTPAEPKFQVTVTLEFERGGVQQTAVFDNLQDAEWRLAEMVHDVFEAQASAGEGQHYGIRGFCAEVQTAAEAQDFADPTLAYAYILNLRTTAGLSPPVPGTEDFADLVVAVASNVSDASTIASSSTPPGDVAEGGLATATEPRPSGSDSFLCTVYSTGLKNPAKEKTFDAAERRLLRFKQAFDRQFDDARIARLVEGFSVDIEVAGVVHNFADPTQALYFVRDLKAAKERGDDLSTIEPTNHVEEFDAGAMEAPPAVEISQAAQTYMAARINQEANVYFLRTRRAPTYFEMEVLRQQIFQEAQLRGLIPQGATYPF